MNKAQFYYQLIVSTRDPELLEQMRLLGFWPPDQGLPADPQAELAERQAIEKELAQLRKSAYVVPNPMRELARERKRRWEESKRRRAQRKKEKAEQLAKRSAEWRAHCQANVVHLGLGVSAGLENRTSNVAELNQRGLPVLHTSLDLANRMGIRLSALRWLTYHRRGATVVHYHRFDIAKKTGGVRCISAPKKALARAQRWVLDNILSKLVVEPCAHGFVAGRSIVSNASPHAGKPIVINLDLKDFFPSITFRRVKGLFVRLGYSEHVATTLALLCTEPPRQAAEVDGKVYHVALGERMLPQGACTSPAITNALCRRLDRRLTALADKHRFTYTRYADDLSFSGDRSKAVGRLLRSVRSILEAEGFAEHPSKTRIMRQANRQEVTGVTVNQRPTISRREVRHLRAILHNAARHGLESQNRVAHPNFAAYLRGKVEFVCMVDPRRGPLLRRLLQAALASPPNFPPLERKE